jgi:hypothetical protein
MISKQGYNRTGILEGVKETKNQRIGGLLKGPTNGRAIYKQWGLQPFKYGGKSQIE